MAQGISAAAANTALDAIRTDTPYMQLHIGDPGVAGTVNKATEVTRKAVTFSAASGGSMTNSAQVQWTNIAGSQDATHFSIFCGAGADTDGTGTFKFSGSVTANGYTAGDTYTAAISAVTLSITVAA